MGCPVGMDRVAGFVSAVFRARPPTHDTAGMNPLIWVMAAQQVGTLHFLLRESSRRSAEPQNSPRKNEPARKDGEVHKASKTVTFGTTVKIEVTVTTVSK